MRPAVALPGKHEPVTGPEQLPLGSQLAEHAAVALRGLPHFLAGAHPGGIRYANGPRRTAPHGGEVLVLVHRGDAQKRHTAAVGRPHRGIVAIHAGVQVMDRFGRGVVYADEAVIAAAADEGQAGAIGRPLEAAVLSAGVDQLLRLLLAVERRRPDLPLAHESHAPAFRRYGRLVTLANQPGRLLSWRAFQRDDPHFLLRALGIVGRIGILTRAIGGLAAHVDDLAGIGSPLQFGDLLAVVAGVRGGAMAAVFGRLGHPDIAHAARVVDPGDLAASGRCDRGGRKGRAHDLLEGERVLRAGAGGAGQRRGEEPGKTHLYRLQQ